MKPNKRKIQVHVQKMIPPSKPNRYFLINSIVVQWRSLSLETTLSNIQYIKNNARLCAFFNCELLNHESWVLGIENQIII